MRKQASILLRKNNARITYLISARSSATGRMREERPGVRGQTRWSPVLVQRAVSEGPRSTRALEDRPSCPMKRDTSELGGIICSFVPRA